MSNLYPLKFQPIFRRYIWGGRRLATQLGKPIGSGNDYAESWEIVDHGKDQSIVESGPLQGTKLSELIRSQPAELLGKRVAAAISNPHLPASLKNRFPLLVKFLDANRDLSVQVHPNDEQASQLHPPDLGKTEAWIVMAAEPGSKIYAGLKTHVDRETFVQAIADNRIEETLHCFEPKPGDCVFIPAGTIHALGAGLLVAEIQQTSDTTFRLFDWNRLGADGQPRELHVEAALSVIDFDRGPVNPISTPEHSSAEIQTLVKCDKFTIERHQISSAVSLETAGCFRMISVIKGAIRVSGDPSGKPLQTGQTMLVPACLGSFHVEPIDSADIILAWA